MFALINCFSGIAGSMFIGALIDAGVPPDYLNTHLNSLRLPSWELYTSPIKINSIACTLAEFRHTQDHHHRKLSDIENIINRSTLPDRVKTRSIHTFNLLAQAEAQAHACDTQDVHFHEVGAIDCILDITGTFLGLDFLNIDHVYATPINLGGGEVHCAHGTMPVPVPAVSFLLKGFPVFASTHQAELTTPTGAAILATLQPAFDPIGLGRIQTFGYGAGTHQYEGANYLSITLLDQSEKTAPSQIMELQTNIDDLSPEIYDFVIDQLLACGAVDVYLTPIIMKKSRPAVKLNVLCAADNLTRICEEIFRQTGSFGIRLSSKERILMESSFSILDTEWGPVRFREGRYGGQVLSTKPEYEDCKKIALAQNLSLPLLYKQLVKRWEIQHDTPA